MELRLQAAGWLTFTLGCIFFVLQSALAGDMLGLAGSVGFLLGCVLFMLSLGLARRPPR